MSSRDQSPNQESELPSPEIMRHFQLPNPNAQQAPSMRRTTPDHGYPASIDSTKHCPAQSDGREESGGAQEWAIQPCLANHSPELMHSGHEITGEGVEHGPLEQGAGESMPLFEGLVASQEAHRMPPADQLGVQRLQHAHSDRWVSTHTRIALAGLYSGGKHCQGLHAQLNFKGISFAWATPPCAPVRQNC